MHTAYLYADFLWRFLFRPIDNQDDPFYTQTALRNSLICKFILLCAFWLGLLAPAFAQISVSYVGGAVSGASTPNVPYTALADGWWGGGGGSAPTETVTCSGGVVVQVTWTGTAQTRPSHLILAKYSESEAYSYLTIPSADNGLGGPHNSTVQFPIFYAYSGFNSGGPVPTYEVVKFDSQTIFRTISPSSSGNISASAKVKVLAYPIQMTLTGLTPSKEILIGQPLRATISFPVGFPLGMPSEYKWYTPAETKPFLDYVVTHQNPNYTAVYTTFPSPLSTTASQTTCHFARSGINKRMRAVLKFPNGTEIGVIESYLFEIIEPLIFEGPAPAGTFAFIDYGQSPAVVTTNDPTDYRMFGAQVPSQPKWGIYWGNWVTTPPGFGTGEFWYTNLITSANNTGNVDGFPFSQTAIGLDGEARQPGTFYTIQRTDDEYFGYFSDRPGFPKLRDQLTESTVSLSYNTVFAAYLMFLPPGNIIGEGKALPIFRRNWKAVGTGSKASGTRVWSGSDGGSEWLESPVKFPPHPVWTTRVVGG